MLRLVDDLLDTSRLDAGRIELKSDSIELTAWLTRMAAAFGQATPPHRVVAHLPRSPPPVNADLDRLGQGVNNLLVNAARNPAAGRSARRNDWRAQRAWPGLHVLGATADRCRAGCVHPADPAATTGAGAKRVTQKAATQARGASRARSELACEPSRRSRDAGN